MDDHPQRITALEVKMDRVEGDTQEIRKSIAAQGKILNEIKESLSSQSAVSRAGLRVLIWAGSIVTVIVGAWASHRWF